MSNRFGHNNDEHPENTHLPEGGMSARFYTSYDEALDQVMFGIVFGCGCELMTAMSLDQALAVHDLFDGALDDAYHHHTEKGI